MAFKKLSPKELEKRGFSKKAERYLDTENGQTISKREYLKRQRAEKGIFESNESLAKKYKQGELQYKDERQRKAAVSKSEKSAGSFFKKTWDNRKIRFSEKSEKYGEIVKYERLEIRNFKNLEKILPRLIGKHINIVAGDRKNKSFATLSYLVTKDSTIDYIRSKFLAMLGSGRYGQVQETAVTIEYVEVLEVSKAA